MYNFIIIFSNFGNIYTSNNDDIKLSIIENISIMKYFFNINLLFPFLLIIIFIKLFVNIILYIDSTIIMIMFIIWDGNTYNRPARKPLYLYVRKIDDMVNPTKKPFM